MLIIIFFTLFKMSIRLITSQKFRVPQSLSQIRGLTSILNPNTCTGRRFSL